MRFVARCLPLVFLFVLVLSGCQRLNFEKTYSLAPVQVQRIQFDPPAYKQKVTVTVSGVKAPVSAYLVKAGDEDKVENVLDQNKPLPTESVLGSRVSKTLPEDYSFEADVPAKVGYTLLLRSEKASTDVKVKVVGK